MFRLDSNGVVALKPHIGDICGRSQVIVMRSHAVAQKRQHVIRAGCSPVPRSPALKATCPAFVTVARKEFNSSCCPGVAVAKGRTALSNSSKSSWATCDAQYRHVAVLVRAVVAGPVKLGIGRTGRVARSFAIHNGRFLQDACSSIAREPMAKPLSARPDCRS